MRICLAQTRPFKGDVQRNVESHAKFIEMAVSHRSDVVVFPELSITGYEPSLAKDLATTKDDRRFEEFQKVADARGITIGIGVPTRPGIYISTVLFQPHRQREIYSKQYIHSDEEPFFARGANSTGVFGPKNEIALAICYELSIPAHSENAFKAGAKIYLASVAKTASGIANAARTLADVARRYSMTVLMSNCVGPCDNFEAAGGSAVWSGQGALLGQLDDSREGILVFDTETQELVAKTV